MHLNAGWNVSNIYMISDGVKPPADINRNQSMDNGWYVGGVDCAQCLTIWSNWWPAHVVCARLKFNCGSFDLQIKSTKSSAFIQSSRNQYIYIYSDAVDHNCAAIVYLWTHSIPRRHEAIARLWNMCNLMRSPSSCVSDVNSNRRPPVSFESGFAEHIYWYYENIICRNNVAVSNWRIQTYLRLYINHI